MKAESRASRAGSHLEASSELVYEPVLSAKKACFDTIRDSPICRIGDAEGLAANSRPHLFLAWEKYTGAGSRYGFLWSGKLHELRVGTKVIATDVQLCLDTGSSGFKGDPEIMTKLISETSADNKSSIVLQTGKTRLGDPGIIEVSPDRYKLMIEEGEHKGHIVPQFFTDVPVPNLLLVGSVLLDLDKLKMPVRDLFDFNALPRESRN